jgi:hypothetical protein
MSSSIGVVSDLTVKYGDRQFLSPFKGSFFSNPIGNAITGPRELAAPAIALPNYGAHIPGPTAQNTIDRNLSDTNLVVAARSSRFKVDVLSQASDLRLIPTIFKQHKFACRWLMLV